MLNKKVTFNFRTSLFSILLVAFLLLTLSVNVIAANEQAYDYFPMTQNQNGYPMQDILDYIVQQGQIDASDYDHILLIACNWQGFYTGWLILSEDALSGDILSNATMWNVDGSALGNGTWVNYEYSCGFDFSWANVWSRDYLPSECYSSDYTEYWNYVSNYNIFEYSGRDRYPILLYDDEVVPEITPPEEVEDPEPDTFDPPTAPSWDSNKTPLENIADLISWVGSLIAYCFEYLFDLISDWFSTIKRTIESAIKLLYDNFVSFFKPYFDKFVSVLEVIKDFFTDPVATFSLLFVPDVSDVTSLIVSADTIGLAPLVTATHTKFVSVYSSIVSVIPVYYFHVPSCTFHGVEIGNFDISFTWFQTYKPYSDTIISAFLIVGWLYWLFTNASGIIRGSSSALHDLQPSNPDK